MSELLRTPLHELHVSNGGKMVPFAGYEMPVQYKDGVLKEHLHCRKKAGLFDVSHMGQVIIKGQSFADIAHSLETLTPISVSTLKEGRQRYGFFTNASGGIIDDLMLSNRGDYLFMVVNAACKHIDVPHMIKNMPNVTVELIEDRALLALQGPLAEKILENFNSAIKEMRFMDIATIKILGVDCWVARSGYTGEDGFEISIPSNKAIEFTEKLLKFEEVKLIGLGARDSLRLEAGLCLYGHDIDCDTSPVEAGLLWAIQKLRREDGVQSSKFLGKKRIFNEIKNRPDKKRIGVKPSGRAPMREGTVLFADSAGQQRIGKITSGGFGPTFEGPVSMGYVDSKYAITGGQIFGEVRGKFLPATIVSLPFVKANFKR
ncbi:glycine cleavage system aminomethyltransferase GcvT [Paracoccaceae bacterium]|nr:glycine cleavage system aminomethyltransferase GcvT [Paracoccaceae bacterium]